MARTHPLWAVFACSLAASSALAADPPPATIPGSVIATDYDGVTNDLLTGGLGTAGIASAKGPGFADPLHPTVAEMRTYNIWSAWQEVYDFQPGGGFGIFVAPNLDAELHDKGGQGMVAGREYVALIGDGVSTDYNTAMVQIPAEFNRARPCMLTAPAPGQRNVWGSLGSSAWWAFNHGCAVAYTDKGTGAWFDDLTQDTNYTYLGQLGKRAGNGPLTNFAVPPTPEMEAYARANPYRLAYKFAHAGTNGEAYWGFYQLQALQFAFWALNDYLGKGAAPYAPGNVLVISTGISNGGGTALRAAELDRQGMISAVVAWEPNAQPTPSRAFTIDYAGGVLAGHSKAVVDYYTLIQLYASCAALAPDLQASAFAGLEPLGTPPGVTGRANRCASLKDKGLLHGTTLVDQANESLERIHAYGFLAESDSQIVPWQYLNGYLGVVDTNVASTGRFRVQEDLCGISFAGIDANRRPAPLAAVTAAQMYTLGNVSPPSSGVWTINDWAREGPIVEQAGTSRSTGRQDLNLDGNLCMRAVATGNGFDHGPFHQVGFERGESSAERVREGIREKRYSGNLHGLPTIIVQGRSDQILPPNFTGRAYFGLNKVVEGARGNASYLEVTYGQHLDALINLLSPGGVAAFAPVSRYYLQALDMMWAHLTAGQPLPASQVVRAIPRGTATLTAANYKSFLPDIALNPTAGNAITFTNHAVNIPQ